MVAVGGALWWYDPSLGPTVFHPWTKDFVLDDTKENGATDDPTDPDFWARARPSDQVRLAMLAMPKHRSARSA